VDGKIKIRSATTADLTAISVLRKTAIKAMSARQISSTERLNQSTSTAPTSLINRVSDGRMLVACHPDGVLASAGLDLTCQELVEVYVAPAAQGIGLGRRMVVNIEKLAVQYGLLQLQVCAAASASPFFHACGYRAQTGEPLKKDPYSGIPGLRMQRKFPHRQTRFGRRLANLLQDLEIPTDYGLTHQLRMQPECNRTISIGKDIAGRTVCMERRAALAWMAMQAAARRNGIELQAVSAFRTVDYQAGIINRKISAGQSIGKILQVSAAPGYSEHHSGRALDISTPGYQALQVHFANSPASQWLQRAAGEFGFSLSYPRNNRHQLAYEPWHWLWRP